MTETDRIIAAKTEELIETSNALTKKHADYERLLKAIAVDSSRCQVLLAELNALRSQLPNPQSAKSQPTWFDNAPYDGDMNDRRIN